MTVAGWMKLQFESFTWFSFTIMLVAAATGAVMSLMVLVLLTPLPIAITGFTYGWAGAAIASVIFGIVLLIAPVVGAMVLTWWLGAYAIVFGVFLLVLAFQLHGKKEERETAKTTAKRVPRKMPAKSPAKAAAKKA